LKILRERERERERETLGIEEILIEDVEKK
jgi:hypothetical protein